MTDTMPAREGSSLQTRPSLVTGMQAGDEQRWGEFFRIYGPVFRGFALKAGLTETEADEVVQETCIGVARNVEEYRYDPARCRFKTWLLNMASWRVKNQFAKRRRWDERAHGAGDSSARPDVEQMVDPAGQNFDALWDAEWRDHLFRAALETIRTRFSATQFQIFDLNVMKSWKAGEVARALGVSVASVYLAKHRVSAALKREVARLEQAH